MAAEAFTAALELVLELGALIFELLTPGRKKRR
jgi:hypothetical protein